MDEEFDASADSGAISDANSEVADSTDIEPLADIPVEEASMDAIDSPNDLEPPISEPELAELQSEAAALEIEPLDEGTGPGFNLDEAIAEQETAEQPYEPSTLEIMANAAMQNVDSPGLPARAIGGLAPPGAKDALTQLAQMGIDAFPPFAEGFMDGIIRQHGVSPAATLENMQINQVIEEGARAAGSIGVELADNEPVYDENGVDLTGDDAREQNGG
jgi:hypothetical protein